MQGRLTGMYYRDNIIEPLVVPFAAAHGNRFRFQDDNACAQCAHVVLNHLQTRGIQSLPWPAMSPDLSPIEHIWDILGRRVQGHVPAPRNLQEMANVLQEEWRRIPQNDIRRLVGSMRRRCVACPAANGGQTRYWLKNRFCEIWCQNLWHFTMKWGSRDLLWKNFVRIIFFLLDL